MPRRRTPARGKLFPAGAAPASISMLHSRISTNPPALRRCRRCPREYTAPQWPPLLARQKFPRENPTRKRAFPSDRWPESPDCRSYFAPPKAARPPEIAPTAQSSIPAKIPASKYEDKPGWPWKGDYTGRARPTRIRQILFGFLRRSFGKLGSDFL